jgi:hypothetical protein
VSRYYDAQVVHVDRSGRVAGTRGAGSSPTDAVFAYGAVWVANAGAGTVSAIAVS